MMYKKRKQSSRKGAFFLLNMLITLLGSIMMDIQHNMEIIREFFL
jgi:hypothetical protein